MATAESFLPKVLDISSLQSAARLCKGCPLYERATQTVFGEGPAHARVMLVGEQPGDQEDRQGRPFVGNAGKLLDRALEEAGVVRSEVYVTNAVKHFKWEERGKRRIHKKPNAAEINACHPWLEAEIEVIKPRAIVCLGSTAAQAVIGPKFKVSTQRATYVKSPLAPLVTATVHPSSILRAPSDEARHVEYAKLVDDLRRIKRAIDEV